GGTPTLPPVRRVGSQFQHCASLARFRRPFAMENTPNRSSGIPRPSKLPVARPVSGIPKPTSTPTLPRPTSTIRPSASRDSLSGSRAGEREPSAESKNPRLRHSVSRDLLHSSTLSQGRNSRLRTSASRDQLLSRRSSRESFSKPPPP